MMKRKFVTLNDGNKVLTAANIKPAVLQVECHPIISKLRSKNALRLMAQKLSDGIHWGAPMQDF